MKTAITLNFKNINIKPFPYFTFYYKNYFAINDALYYPPYGSALPGLQYNYIDDGDTSKYRFGFNNQEQDSELGDYYAFEYRIHDARLGRFLSVDPLSFEYPWYTPYQFAGNTPFWAVELEGLEPEIKSSVAGSNPNVVKYTFSNDAFVTLDASKGDQLHVDNGKVTGYLKDGVENNWNQDFGYFWNGQLQVFIGGTIKTDRPKTFAQWEANFSSTDGIPYKVLSTAFELSPQACGWNSYTGVFYGEDMYGNEQSSLETAGNIVGAAGAVAGKAITAGAAKLASKTVSIVGKYTKHIPTFGPRTLSAAAKFTIPKGFKLAKEFGYIHGQKVYSYMGKYYSKDIDSHNGGVWKVFELINGTLKRIGTADENLNIFAK